MDNQSEIDTLKTLEKAVTDEEKTLEAESGAKEATIPDPAPVVDPPVVPAVPVDPVVVPTPEAPVTEGEVVS